MFPQRLLITALCAALAGCAAVGPDTKPASTTTPADWSSWHGGDAQLNDVDLRSQTGAILPGFHDPILSALLKQAAAANQDLQTAALHLAQSRVQRGITAAQTEPQINASAAAQRQRQSSNGSTTRMANASPPASRDALLQTLSEPFKVYQAGFDASWELDMWGRVRRSVEAADASVLEAAAALQQVRLGIAAEVARNYFDLRNAQLQAALVQADIDLAEDTLKLTRARQTGGLTDHDNRTRQQSQLADLRGHLPTWREQEAQTLNQLTLLTAQPPGALQSLLQRPADGTAPQDAVPLPDLTLGLPSELALRRPDIQSAQARLRGATARIGVAQADLYPRITLGASAGLESLNGGKFGDWGSRQWSLGPSLHLPLFDGGRLKATVELRELEQQEAAVAYQQTVLRAWHEIDTALSGYSAEQLRHAQLTQREQANRSTWQLAHSRYVGGLSDQQPELEARRILLQSERDSAQSRTALTQRLLIILKSLGAAPE